MFTTDRLPVGEHERFRIATKVVNGAGGRLTIFSGESLQRVDDTLNTVRTALAIGLPLLVLLVAIVSWVGTKRALRPVEEIRAEVAEITATDLHRRVPEPATGDEVSGLAVTMNEMLDRLEGASQRQARFVADASHELRSPVTSLRAQLEIGLSRRPPLKMSQPSAGRSWLSEEIEPASLPRYTAAAVEISGYGVEPITGYAGAHQHARCVKESFVRAKQSLTSIGQPVPELPVTDVERAQEHYRDALGFDIGWLYPGKEIGAVSRGNVAIFFRKKTPPFEAAVHWVFAEDIDATYDELKSSGANIVEPLEKKPWGLRQFTVEDIDGNRFYFHHD